MEISPINETEKRIIESDEFKRILGYGKVRSGHPEGAVGNHIKLIIEYIEEHYKDDAQYEKLRILALLHDLGKSDERKRPHSQESADIAKKFIEDKELIEIIKVHDEPYHFWRRTVKRKNPLDEEKFKEMFKKLDWKLLVKFRYCDNCARSQAPSEWFEQTCKGMFK